MNLAQILESDMTKYDKVWNCFYYWFSSSGHPSTNWCQIPERTISDKDCKPSFDHKLGVLFIIISWLSLKISFFSLILLQKTIINYILGKEGYSDPTAKMCQYSFKVCWRSACIHYGVYGHDSSINLLCHWKHVKGMTYPDSSMISHTEMTPL